VIDHKVVVIFGAEINRLDYILNRVTFMMTVDKPKVLKTRLNRTTLVEQVAQNLMDFIEDNQLKPGDTLPASAELADNFGVSRPVVREALKFLEAKGLIEIANGKKPAVKPITTEPLLGFFDRIVKVEREALREFMEVRQGLEIQSASLAALRRTPEELQELKVVITAMAQNLDDPDAFADLDVEFHLLIAKASHNTMLVRLIKSIRESLRVTVGEGLRHRFTDKQFEPVQRGHEAILRAIEQGNPAAASEAMRAHFEGAILSIWGV
jgi:DNA-binding FadR family transcriptional regulator